MGSSVPWCRATSLSLSRYAPRTNLTPKARPALSAASAARLSRSCVSWWGTPAASGQGPRTPARGLPEYTTHLQIGLVSVPHPGPAFPGAVPAHGQGIHQQRESRVQEGVLGIHQQPHVLGPGVLRVRGTTVRPQGVQHTWRRPATAGVTWATRCKRLREAWRCWFCWVLRQETWRSWGSSREARMAQVIGSFQGLGLLSPTTQKGEKFRNC